MAKQLHTKNPETGSEVLSESVLEPFGVRETPLVDLLYSITRPERPEPERLVPKRTSERLELKPEMLARRLAPKPPATPKPAMRPGTPVVPTEPTVPARTAAMVPHPTLRVQQPKQRSRGW